jgi:arylsulfatase A-like enzyme
MGPYSAIRKGDWKLIYFYGPQQAELYNLKEDIGEHHNLIEKYPEKAITMMDKLLDMLKDENAQFPVNQKTGALMYPHLNRNK